MENKLVPVPIEQQEWFENEWDIINVECNESEYIYYEDLQDWIFGKKCFEILFFNLIGDFSENYKLDKDETISIVECLFCCYEDAKEADFYEIANNLQLIVSELKKEIDFYK